MDIKDRTILVFGGAGLVGMAICRKLVGEKPKKIILTSLLQTEALEAVKTLQSEFPKDGKKLFIPWWGNIFLRHTYKDIKRDEVVEDPEKRIHLIEDILGELDEAAVRRTAIYQLVNKYKPDIIIDCINAATAIAYQDIFNSARSVFNKIRESKHPSDSIVESAERLLASLYIPQLIRHVQQLYRSMLISRTKYYVKIGTSGTGGMGLNIPYTHSEERPSSVLLSKSAVAGAHTLLLFLMGRTPDSPIIKEIKPTAAIGWKRVAFGEIRKRGIPIELYDCPPARGLKLSRSLKIKIKNFATPLNKKLSSVFIDTGENGLFSRGEFEAITTPGQMEYVTPEEIADSVIYEILGGNTGHDIINALDNAALGPTYRAGYLFESAKKQIIEMEKKHGIESVAFEMLGPPRLSKLLYEGYLLKTCCNSMRNLLKSDHKALARKLNDKIKTDRALRSRIISIGIPILMADGKTLLRGDSIKIPVFKGDNELPVTPKSINLWAHDGWVDLRPSNMKRWKSRIHEIISRAEAIPSNDTSSRYLNNRKYWDDFGEINPGKVAGWIFSYEEKGMRMKN